MIWIDSISELQYYKSNYGLPCYCERIMVPNDILLQAQVYTGIVPGQIGSGATYSVVVQAYSADGLTLLGDITPSFEWYAFAVSAAVYVNLMMIKFSPIICAQKCFILKVTISQIAGATLIVFSKFTERFCLDNCCVLPSGIDIEITT